MTPAANARLRFVLLILLCLGLALGIALFALRDNVAFFYSPSDVARLQQAEPARFTREKIFRLGGLIEKGSVTPQDKDLKISFIVTDFEKNLRVVYTGLKPDLFREGQGVVATGYLGADNVFYAQNLLAKHDENYMPPEVHRALKDKKK